jgi:hypothetical protein
LGIPGWCEGAGALLVATLLLSGVSTAQAESTDASPSDARPADAAGVFPVWPGSGVPPGAEQWTWHEQTLHVPGFGGANGIVRKDGRQVERR